MFLHSGRIRKRRQTPKNLIISEKSSHTRHITQSWIDRVHRVDNS